jgi:hypothetical protein
MISECPNVNLVDQALWRVHSADGDVCVAESGEATYLVLFTSLERAAEFMQDRNPSWGPTATATLYSATQAEFLSESGEAAALGLDGAVIDPAVDGHVRAIVDFCREETDIPVPFQTEE